jgi:hypothetical protein
VKAALTTEGNNCLPLLLVNGRIASKGLYPDRKLLAQMMGIDLTEAAPGLSLPIIQSASQD